MVQVVAFLVPIVKQSDRYNGSPLEPSWQYMSAMSVLRTRGIDPFTGKGSVMIVSQTLVQLQI